MPLTQAEEDLLQTILNHCTFALGSGAQMPIKRGAIETLRTHTRGDATKGFERALFNAKNPNDPKDVDPGQPRWDRDGNFILSCCQTIGSIAAADAKSQGAVVINTQILMNAYQKVRVANSPPVPGEYCPA